MKKFLLLDVWTKMYMSLASKLKDGSFLKNGMLSGEVFDFD
jgi:hypothetical protein